MHFPGLLAVAAGIVATTQAGLVPDLVKGVTDTVGKVTDTVEDVTDKVGDAVHVGNDNSTPLMPAHWNLARSWDDGHILFEGVSAPATEVSPAVNLGLSLHKAQISGNVALGVDAGFLEVPKLRLSLDEIKAYLEIDVAASASIQESLELFASSKISADILETLEVDLSAAFALDLVVSVSAAIDLRAGVYVNFGEDAWVDIDLITKEVSDSHLVGLQVKALPVGVGADVDLSAAIELGLGLRLRTHVSLEAEVDIVGLDLIDAGLEISVWVMLFDYTAVIVNKGDCALAITEKIALKLGIAIKLDVEVLDVLDFSLVPTVFVTLATGVEANLCLPDRNNESNDFPGLPGNGGANEDGPGGPTTEVATPTGGYPSKPTTDGYGMVTSVTTTTASYTVTHCAASVHNCPASWTQKVVTSTVKETTTVCPVQGTAYPTSKPPTPVTTITETCTTMVPCETTETSTFVPPTDKPCPSAPTVTVEHTTSVCPTETPSATPIPPAPVSPSTSCDTPVQTPTQTPGYPCPTCTMTSIVAPTGGYTVPPAVTPSAPVTAGAGSVKVGGMALVFGAVVAAAVF